ncbi:MAG TPA: hypothetical protein VGI72_00530 [Gaiellales bacterium]
MSDERHEDIAARLRAEAGARAPERLQADVMLRVRAEPRPRRIRHRRVSWRPLGSLAAAACVLAALVFGISHVDISGGGEASGGGSSAAGFERAAAPQGVGGGGATARGQSIRGSSLPGPSAVLGLPDTHQAASTPSYAQKLLAYRAMAEHVPRPLRAAVYGRLVLTSPLPKALGPLHLRRGRGSH